MNNRENMLDFIFDARSEELAKLTEEDREFLDSPEVDINKDFLDFLDSISELPKELQDTIIEKVNTCCDTVDLIHAYYYKKYYKLGFSECLKLILNCINI